MTTFAGTDLARFLEEVEFPATRDDLAACAGDRTVQFGRHPLRLGRAIRSLPGERFEEPSDFVRALQEHVPDEESLH